MPFFTKFSNKKTPIRKSSLADNSKDIEQDYNFLEDDNVIRLCLGDSELLFEDGQWIPESGTDGQTHKVNQKLRKQVQALKEENNLLQLKFDILLDMLTQTTAENILQQHKVEKFKRNIK